MTTRASLICWPDGAVSVNVRIVMRLASIVPTTVAPPFEPLKLALP
jgi:hypothetical protein